MSPLAPKLKKLKIISWVFNNSKQMSDYGLTLTIHSQYCVLQHHVVMFRSENKILHH